MAPDEQFDADAWVRAFMDSIGYRDLSSGAGLLFGCDCGCLIYPMTDSVLYLDRYEAAPGDCSEGLSTCPCHTFPSSVPVGAGNVIWSQMIAGSAAWAATNTRTMDRSVPRCRDCSQQAVAFVIEPYSMADENAGPHWVCADALGAPVPDSLSGTASMDTSEPESHVAARKQAQVMRAACPSITCRS